MCFTNSKAYNFGTAFSVVVILVSLYLNYEGDHLQERLVDVINGLIQVEHNHIKISPPRVAVGYGACVDLYVNGKHFLPYKKEADTPQHYNEISNFQELYQSYAYYFRNGAASERYVSNSSLFDDLLAMANRREANFLVSGNAPVMAKRLYNEGCEVLLAASLSHEKRKHIPKGIKIVGPVTERDDYHLVIEYKAGEQWGPYTSPRANRYILHNDYNNPHLTSFEEFDNSLKEFNPHLLIVSGLQLMDNFPFEKGIQEKLLNQVSRQMTTVSEQTKVHFEMASIADERFLWNLIDKVVPFADSLGMNEQELANMYSLYMYGNNTLVTNSMPRVATVLDQMREVFKRIRTRNNGIKGSRKLTRLHVHTLAYQAVLTEGWKYTDIAAAKASLTAFRHVCASPLITPDQATLLMDESFSKSTVGNSRAFLIPENPVSCWSEHPSVEVCVAPGIVCTSPSITAGGGDNISAAALAMQLVEIE